VGSGKRSCDTERVVEPVVHRPGAGETVTDRPQRTVRILADDERVTVTASRYAAGERGPDLHVHHEHADAFWVLVGELRFELGAERRELRLSAGEFLLAPPDCAHAFWNEGPGEVRYLNVHAPDAGFAAQLRGGPPADTHPPPADGGRPAGDALMRDTGAGPAFELGGTRGVFKAIRDDAMGSFSLMEYDLAAGFPGPVAHRHRDMVDSFFVTEGTLALQLGDDRVDAPAGTWASVPPHHVHTFSNPGPERVRLLNLMAPAGLERYLAELAAAARPDAPPDPGVMARIAARYDFEPA
jgi:mannose-6-phosphate isomerase-like protein (cupin superfamily)